jgi:hypothetical protein
VTTNIVNFYSPSETDYTTVSIDVDPQPVSDSDSDQYFNLATVAIQKELGNIEITLHRQEGPGYKGPSECDDCKAVYNLEFKSNAGSRWYQFINDDGTFIIITMKNPIPSHSDLLEMLASIKIPPSVHQKQR